jgi:putative transposase
MKVLRLPLSRRSRDLYVFAARAIRSVKHECLNRLVILGKRHVKYLTREYVDFYNRCRPRSARDHLPPCLDRPTPPPSAPEGLLCDVRLGGLLRHYYRQPA